MATGIITMKSVSDGVTRSLLVLADTTAAVGTPLKMEVLEVPTVNSPNFQILPYDYVIQDVYTKEGVTGFIQLYVDGTPKPYFIDLAAQAATNSGRTPMVIPLMREAEGKTLKIEWRVKEVITGY